jgi:hypothetical protein
MPKKARKWVWNPFVHLGWYGFLGVLNTKAILRPFSAFDRKKRQQMLALPSAEQKESHVGAAGGALSVEKAVNGF